MWSLIPVPAPRGQSSRNARALFGLRNDGRHYVTVAVKSVIHHGDRGNLVIVQGKRLWIKMSKPRFMYATRPTAGRRSAQVLESATVFVEGCGISGLGKNVVKRNAGQQSVIGHFPAGEHAGEFRAQVGDHAAGPFMRVSLGVVFPTAGDVKKVGIHVESLDSFCDAREQPLPP